MWVDSEGSARGCDTSCVRVLLPHDHGPEHGVGLVPRCCWCCGAGRTLPAPCPWSPREEPPGSRPPQGWEQGGEPLLPLGTTKTLPLHPRLSPPDRTLGVRLCSGSLCFCSTSPGRAAGPESGQPSGGWGPGQAGAAGAAAGGCGGCSCLWLRQHLRHTLVLRDTETSHHGLLFKQDEGFYFFSLSLRIPHGFQR